MLLSYKLANSVFLSALVFATFASGIVVTKLVSTAILSNTNENIIDGEILAITPIKEVYETSPYLLPISWGAVIGTVVWKGRVRSVWSKQGYDYDTFKIIARMRGSPIRVRLLNLLHLPKNKTQLAKELEMDWKTIDNHIVTLQKHKLIEEMATVGSSKYYIISEHGKKILDLLSNNDHNQSSVGNNNIEHNRES